MQINISTRHGQLSPDTRETITEKVKKLSRLFERLTAVEITIDLEHADSPGVELRVSAERREDFVATAGSSSMMAALDGAVHKLEQQLRKHKEKLKGHRTPGHRHLEVPAEPESETE